MSNTALSPLARAQDDQQRYQQFRRHHPELFGNHPDGSMDGTPETGPKFAFAVGSRNRKAFIYTFWSVHKHAWPLQFIYHFGDVIDCRGERIDPELLIDIRDLGPEIIGTNRILRAEWGSKSHLEVLSRALTEGDLLDRITTATIPF